MTAPPLLLADTQTLVIAITVPLGVAVIGLMGVVLGAALTRWSEAANKRRDSYAAAIQTLQAWVEFPYRIRRRTSDAPDELGRLANLGHDLQERLRCHASWIRMENNPLGEHYDYVLRNIGPPVGTACSEAWDSQPITTAPGMKIGPWGPGEECASFIAQFERAAVRRFGLRRMLGPFRRIFKRSSDTSQATLADHIKSIATSPGE